jgi:hypothetical protein
MFAVVTVWPLGKQPTPSTLSTSDSQNLDLEVSEPPSSSCQNAAAPPPSPRPSAFGRHLTSFITASHRHKLTRGTAYP